MTALDRLNSVRDSLASWMGRNGYEFDGIFQESLLIRDGFYCGRRFRTPLISAVWFAEEDELKVYAAEGEMIDRFSVNANQVVDGIEISREQTRAA